jgi:hypothetical protein
LARDGQTPSLHGCTRGVSWAGPPDPGAGLLESQPRFSRYADDARGSEDGRR